MDRERITKAATGHKASDINQRMNRRMKAYAFGIAIILAVLYAYGPEAPVEKATRAEQPLGPVDVPVGDAVQSLAQIDKALLAEVADGTVVERSRIEAGPRRHLMKQAGRLVFGDLGKLGLAPGDWETLVTGAADQRGQPFWILGTLAWWQEERVDGYTEIRGEVVDRAGQPWAFLSVTEPYNLKSGDVVKLAGFYLKSHEMLRPDGELVTAPLIVADEVLASAYRIEPVTEYPGEQLSSVRDYNIAQASRPLDSLAFYELLSFVNTAEVEQVLPTDAVSELMPSELLATPSDWRGEPVALTGVLYFKTEAPLGPRGENPLGVPFAWNLWVSDNRAGAAGTMLVVSLDEPVNVTERQIVTIKGRFYRRFAFENKANSPRMAAVIIASEIEPLIPEENTLTPLLLNIILVMVGLVAAFIMLGQWREQRAMATARTQRMRRHRVNVARPGMLSSADSDGSSPGAVVDPPPENE